MPQFRGRPEQSRPSLLDRLEDRFDKLEARQVTFESRVDTEFDTIQDSLRQLREYQSEVA